MARAETLEDWHNDAKHRPHAAPKQPGSHADPQSGEWIVVDCVWSDAVMVPNDLRVVDQAGVNGGSSVSRRRTGHACEL